MNSREGCAFKTMAVCHEASIDNLSDPANIFAPKGHSANELTL